MYTVLQKIIEMVFTEQVIAKRCSLYKKLATMAPRTRCRKQAVIWGMGRGVPILIRVDKCWGRSPVLDEALFLVCQIP